jgi:hypothetical protein
MFVWYPIRDYGANVDILSVVKINAIVLPYVPIRLDLPSRIPAKDRDCLDEVTCWRRQTYMTA